MNKSLQVFINKYKDEINDYELQQVIADARRWHVLGSFAANFDQTNLSESSQQTLSDIFLDAKIRADFDRRRITNEAKLVCRLFTHADIPVWLTKGAAYQFAVPNVAKGRLTSDLDILVRDHDLNRAEEILLAAGWVPDQKTANERDQTYYRDEMHELPPLRHKVRGSLIDVHFRLLPRTAKFDIDHQMMMDSAKLYQIAKGAQAYIFSPSDIFIYSATHAFLDGELSTPGRTALELHGLWHNLSEQEKLGLHDRAKELGVIQAYDYALDYLTRCFGNEIFRLGYKPSFSRKLWTGIMVASLNTGRISATARQLLILRGHYLRAPLKNTLKHQWRKWREGEKSHAHMG